MNYYAYDEGWAFYRTTTARFGVGLQGSVGVQWAATDWLALHAEYGVLCGYDHRVTRSERVYTGEDGYYEKQVVDTGSVSIEPRYVRFGLSAYFQ